MSDTTFTAAFAPAVTAVPVRESLGRAGNAMRVVLEGIETYSVIEFTVIATALGFATAFIAGAFGL